MRLPAIHIVRPRHARNLARRIISEALRQVVARPRQIVGQAAQPRCRVIAKALHRPIAKSHARPAARRVKAISRQNTNPARRTILPNARYVAQRDARSIEDGAPGTRSVPGIRSSV
jgi:hypothetical protein